jgi:phage-related tail fiber protein
MADFYTLLTNAGIAYENACKAAGQPIKLTQISVGDGNGAVYNPAATATALKREVWRGPLNALFQDAQNPSWLLAEVTIPPEEGGFYVREAGLWTDTGILYAIVKYPESFKPVLASSGSGKEFYIRAIFETSNASSVTLLIDDTVVKATRAWVMGYLADELAKLDGKQSVRVATTANIVLSGAQQIDGVAVVSGQRVLVTAQTAPKDNGIYVAANGDWVRSTDSNTSAKVTPGLTVMVEEGTANGDSLWHLVTNGPITLGTTALSFEMLAGRTGIQAGTYKSLTVDKYGRATGGTNPDTLAGFGITDTYTKAQIEAMIAQASALPVGTQVSFPVISDCLSRAVRASVVGTMGEVLIQVERSAVGRKVRWSALIPLAQGMDILCSASAPLRRSLCRASESTLSTLRTTRRRLQVSEALRLLQALQVLMARLVPET